MSHTNHQCDLDADCDHHDCGHHGDDHHHDGGPLAELVTVRDWLRYAVTRFNRNDVFFGHGCTNAFDEAVWLLTHALAIPADRLEPFMDACILGEERAPLLALIDRRVDERVPTAYLTNEAWLHGFKFKVDPRVIIPRSFFAELLENGFAPWVNDPERIASALDLCCGSGCLAILMADAFPAAQIVAVDLSEDALAVARDNVDDYGLNERIELVRSDLFDALAERRFDLIISNPPYVTASAMQALPPEYLHEPRMALAAGEDGLDIVRRILAHARAHLNPGGLLAVEIGHNRAIVESAFPELPFIWLTATGSSDMVFMLSAEDLPA